MEPAAADSVYRMVYDVRQAWPNTLWLAIPLSAIAGIGGWFLREQARNGAFAGGFLPWSFALFAISSVGFVMLGCGSVLPYALMRSDLARGQFVTREGLVRDFTPGDPGDHVEERWILRTPSGDFGYSYTPSRWGAGYDRTAAHGGLVREGVRVRVTEVNSRIARLEILEEASRAAQPPN
jgi:hypothetical protein